MVVNEEEDWTLTSREDTSASTMRSLKLCAFVAARSSLNSTSAPPSENYPCGRSWIDELLNKYLVPL